jgi:hydroxyacylglutathione hydrolase
MGASPAIRPEIYRSERRIAMAVEVVVLKARSDNYAYLVRDEGSGKVASIDAPEAGPILAALEERGWELDQLWITHHHADHVEGVEELRSKTGCEVVGHVKDIGRLPHLDREVSEGEKVHLGESVAEISDVSGHTIGHIAYLMPDAGVAFTADSLMALGCGRVFEGTHEMMWKSLEKLTHLPQETRIYSGHNYGKQNGRFAMTIEPDNRKLEERIKRIEEADGKGEPIVPATLREELDTNPFLRASNTHVKELLGLSGADDAAVFAEIRRRKDAF